jgi:glycosyltransferase involved in cell wall biosynthesis
MNGAPRVSLLMPVHNRAHLLEQVLEHLAENTTYEEQRAARGAASA